MIDRLIDLLATSAKLFWPIAVVDEFEGAVVLRLGTFSRDLAPGWHWIWPFAIDRVLTCWTCIQTVDLEPQSLTTANGQAVVVRATVVYVIDDARTHLLKVASAGGVIEDAATGSVSDYIMGRTWEQLQAKDLAHEIGKEIRRKAKEFGVAVRGVYLKDFQRCRSIRILGKQ
ncbi:HflC Membrane protease subunits, stomatin/prohibitin homologs [uncultured Caudovirales phage]|uniref:HflC Membrane protease subunits, stomatin/prohibitin homologs n=1 Tax=uncultured Caudovirales phage TaxID=2100421 RepID=A0A6J5LZW9_9CAUD|nr:HflC Membrane protease subunits, stomatin/prohibitin homologs [uncultured Caudovirales phage]